MLKILRDRFVEHLERFEQLEYHEPLKQGVEFIFFALRLLRPREMSIDCVTHCFTMEDRGDFFLGLREPSLHCFNLNMMFLRGMVERDRDIEERRVAEMAEKLSVYKREVRAGNFNRSSANQSQ